MNRRANGAPANQRKLPQQLRMLEDAFAEPSLAQKRRERLQARVLEEVVLKGRAARVQHDGEREVRDDGGLAADRQHVVAEARPARRRAVAGLAGPRTGREAVLCLLAPCPSAPCRFLLRGHLGLCIWNALSSSSAFSRSCLAFAAIITASAIATAAFTGSLVCGNRYCTPVASGWHS